MNRSIDLLKNIDRDRIALVDLLKDRPWSNRSSRSFKKIDRDRITLVDLWKRLKRSNRSHRSLRKIKKIESFSSIFEKDWKDLIALRKRVIRLKKCIFRIFLTVPPFLWQKIESLPSILEDRPWSNWSSRSLKNIDHKRIDLLITKIDRFERKTDYRVPNPATNKATMWKDNSNKLHWLIDQPIHQRLLR